MRPSIVVLGACVALSLGFSGAVQAQTIAFDVPGHGAIHLRLPSGVRSQSKPVPSAAAVAIAFESATGDYNVQVTAIWLDPSRQAKARDALRGDVEAAALGPAAQSIEKVATIQQLQGSESFGYFYTLTDRAPPPGEYKLLTQGTMIVGELLCTFTFLERSVPVPQRAAIMEMLRSATHQRGVGAIRPPVVDAAKVDERPRITVEGGIARIAGPQGSPVLIADDPGLNLIPNPSAGGGARYFSLRGKDALLFTGWFEPASRFAGLTKFWQGETAEWKRNGLPAPTNVEFLEVDGWHAVVYGIPTPAGTLPHVRAHRVEGGTWIDVHLSIAAVVGPADARERFRKVLSVLRIEAAVKAN